MAIEYLSSWYLAQDLRPLSNIFYLKGQCQENFDFRFSTWISFPWAPDCTNRAVSNFFKNSRRYLQLKVQHWCRWHRWQMKKSSIRKFFIISFGHLLVELAYRYIFFFIAPTVCISHRCHVHRWQICRQFRWYGWQFVTGVVDTGGKFATDINNNSKCHWYWWCTLTWEYLREFSSDSWKKLEAKNLVTLSL